MLPLPVIERWAECYCYCCAVCRWLFNATSLEWTLLQESRWPFSITDYCSGMVAFGNSSQTVLYAFGGEFLLG